ncbi:hypothetical protein L7F22_058027 [Adiantum nelumboides]|nr:hypothetical protein [Adiantum nelumboides]
METVEAAASSSSSWESLSTSLSPLPIADTIFRLLPDELLERLFCFLPLSNVFVYRLVCKHWNALLRSHGFLANFDVYNQRFMQLWITFFDGPEYADERSILLYDPSLQKWRRLSLAFLPMQFNIAIAAAGGLFCVANNTVHNKRMMSACNPFTKMYKELPPLQINLIDAHAIMEQREDGSYKVYVLSSGLMAVYDSISQHWLNISMGERMRPRSPVICRDSIYGLRDEGSLWWQSWKLVVSDLNMFVDPNEGPSSGLYAGSCNWCLVNQSNGDEFSASIRRPRLLGADGCLLLVGGLKNSVLTYSCSTFIIYKFDFTALKWVEVTKMPLDLYWGFHDLAYVKIFGSNRHVFFFCEMTNAIVACNLSSGVIWQKVVNCPDLMYCISGLFKGFTFNVKLGSDV